MIKAYNASYVDEVEDIFVSAGACIKVRNNIVFLFVQKDELANLKVNNKENYMLSLARRSAFDISSTNIPTVDDSVTGFVIDKIHFDGVSGNIATDADIADAIQVLVTNNDLLQFIIYSEVHLTEVVHESNGIVQGVESESCAQRFCDSIFYDPVAFECEHETFVGFLVIFDVVSTCVIRMQIR